MFFKGSEINAFNLHSNACCKSSDWGPASSTPFEITDEPEPPGEGESYLIGCNTQTSTSPSRCSTSRPLSSHAFSSCNKFNSRNSQVPSSFTELESSAGVSPVLAASCEDHKSAPSPTSSTIASGPVARQDEDDAFSSSSPCSSSSSVLLF